MHRSERVCGTAFLSCRRTTSLVPRRPGLHATGLLRAACVPLRDQRYRDELVARAGCAPAAVEHDAEQRLLVLAADRDAVHALGSCDRAQEFALRREHVGGFARGDVDAAFRIYSRTVAALAAPQLAEIALVLQ